MPPQIRMVLGHPRDWIERSIRALRSDPDIFVRDKELAHVTRITEEESRESEWVDSRGRRQRALVPGSPQIHPMETPTLRVRMAETAAWTKPKPLKGGGFEDAACEPSLAQAVEVRCEKHWAGLRHLHGVSETPFPRPDLSIVQGEPRWDPATGYLYEPGLAFATVAEEPLLAEAETSRRALEDLFVDFPFASLAGLSAAVALLVTMLVRPAIRGPCPAWIIDATTMGTGKSLLVDVCAAVAYGRDAGRDPFPSTTGRGADEELAKQLGFLARTGTPLVNFDNCDEVQIGSDCLEKIISAPGKYRFRVLGKSDGLELPVRMLFAFSANNATWSRGMTRRVLHVRLESPLENPEHRPLDTYQHPERAGKLLAYALENRALYVHHALTLIRAFACAADAPRLTIGTFEEWAGLVPSAIVWAGGEDPMLCRPGADGEETPETMQRQTLAREWAAFLRASSRTGMTAHDVIEALYPQLERGQPPDPKWEMFRGAIEFFVPPRAGQAPDAKLLGDVIGKRFRNASIRTHDAPAPMRRFAHDGKSGGRVRWKVEDVLGYVGNKLPARSVPRGAPEQAPPALPTPPPVAPVTCPACERPRGNRGYGGCEPCARCGRCYSYQGDPPMQSEVCQC